MISKLFLLLSSFSAAVLNDPSRVAFFWQSNGDKLETKSDYEYVYQQWNISAHSGFLMGGAAYIMDMDTGKLEVTGAPGQRVEQIGFSVWKSMGLKISAMIYIYDYKLSSPTSFIDSAIEKMKTFSLDGFHIEYRPTPGKLSNQTNLNSFMDFLDQFGKAMNQVNPHAMLSVSGGICPSYGQFGCVSALSTSLSGYLGEGHLSATTAAKFQATESQYSELKTKFWPAFSVDETLGEANWSGLLTYLGKQNYAVFGSMCPKNLGLQPNWYLNEIVKWLDRKL